jgi:hypothetical protein
MSSDVSQELRKIREEIREMRQQMNRIEELLLNNVEKNCKKMGEHIDFVESVYEKVKNPLSYVCGKVSSMASIVGHSNTEYIHALPEINHDEE